MKSDEIRKKFLDYFKTNDHEIVHSGSLVPHNDSTLMFTNSGMVQFKNVFTDKENKNYLRAVTAQKCVRAGGKHNDLEQVGYTSRHHTFFEMLGNFSFGDYFKDVAIELAWKLITKDFGLNKNKLLVTVFEQDDESFNLWKKISDLPEDQIIKINTLDNFWSMGETGPCGPCSEIFYDHGDKYPGGPPGSQNEDGDRFIEIWNLVFMQFEQISREVRKNLPKPSIDTGMGLERISALMQGTNDNYATDLFIPLIEKSRELCNSEKYYNSPSHKVIADHLRASAFLISDGVLPSNEGRGYVLRRIMRRGMRHAHTIGNKDPIFHKIFPVLLNQMKNSYPEIERSKNIILDTLINEETKFKTTLDNGLKILEEEINVSLNKVLSGDIAFKLYDTYGFPLDLTQDYLKNKKISVDIKKFNENMKLQKSRARKKWKGTGDDEISKILFEATSGLDPTEFNGYKVPKSSAIIIQTIINEHLNKNGGAIIITNQSPFYAESGGQIGDIGFIRNENFLFEVTNTTKLFGNLILHHGIVKEGSCNINDEVHLKINENRRNLIKNNHSATHLLHASLRQILGNHVAQRGSLVSDEKLRFDFNHNQPIEKNQIEQIEKIINKIIDQDDQIQVRITDYQSAVDEGAIALFGEKYGEEVREVSMGKQYKGVFSKELCGGTHVKSTGDIKKFKIINQTSVSSGVRRFEAVTSFAVDEYIKNQQEKAKFSFNKTQYEIDKAIRNIEQIDQKFHDSLLNNLNKFDNLQDKNRFLQKTLTELRENKYIEKNKENINSEKIGTINYITLNSKNYPINKFKLFIDEQKKINLRSIIVLASSTDSKVSIIIGITDDIIDKFDARSLIFKSSKIIGGSGGGGRRDLAQTGGNEKSKIPEVFSIIKEEIIKIN